MLYGLVVVPFCAVTFTRIKFSPIDNGTAAEVEPDEVCVPFTVTLALASDNVGLKVSEVLSVATVAVYELMPDENDGDRAPSLRLKLFKLPFDER